MCSLYKVNMSPQKMRIKPFDTYVLLLQSFMNIFKIQYFSGMD